MRHFHSFLCLTLCTVFLDLGLPPNSGRQRVFESHGLLFQSEALSPWLVWFTKGGFFDGIRDARIKRQTPRSSRPSNLSPFQLFLKRLSCPLLQGILKAVGTGH